ncbi:hypothetical protein ACJMK2_025713 [Sinanodonta woodiana]|uniref:Uncharacterized protein n=1 Tax=Sinanodonta woodiana TaxID=1069815 RepID=A0ABD3XHD4_SINWO
MAKDLHCCKFVLLTALAALSKVSGIITNTVCEGDTVQIFQNISTSRSAIKFSLYKIGLEREEVIAIWLVNHSHIEDKIKDTYKSKLSFESGTILLRNIESTDEATYTLVDNIHYKSEWPEMHISTLVPPTNHCKPKIRQEDNVLIALLDNQEYCGTPQVSVHWKEYPDISYKDKAVIEVPPGKDVCTYYACIEGEALRCTRRSSERDYCEHITLRSTRKESIPIPSPDIHNTTTFVIAAIVFLILIAMIVYPIIVWKYPDQRRDDHHFEPLSLQENIEMQEM